MKLKNALFSLALVGTTALVTATVVSQDHPGADAPEWNNPMMERSEHHEKLDKFVGKWDNELKHWEAPGTEPHVMTGTSEYKWILGDRYLKGTFHGEFGGMPFEGLEIMGYDNLRKEFFSLWFDNFGTGYAVSKGNYKGDTMQMSGTMDDAMSGAKDIKTRSVGTEMGDDKMKFEMFVTDKSGNETKVMEIVSTRKN